MLPKFSIKFILIFTTSSAIFFLMLRYAYLSYLEGSKAEIVAMLVPVGFITLLAIYHSVVFLISLFFAGLFGLLRHGDLPQSPFATDRLPEQILPPRDPD